MAKIDQRLVDLLKLYGEDNSAVWDCHGTWVAYHAAVERMAAKAGIVFHLPEMIVNEPEKKTVVVCVMAMMGEKSEWSFGEVTPANNKNAYPYAMAEKRAKDRVALKLLGMAGLAYSEEEADDFKESKPSRKADHAPKPAEPDPKVESLYAELSAITKMVGLTSFWKDNNAVIKAMSEEDFNRFTALKDKKKAELDFELQNLSAG